MASFRIFFFWEGGGGGVGKQVRWANSEGGGGGASGGMLPQIILILISLKCQEMHFKLINEFLNYYTVASVPDRKLI